MADEVIIVEMQKPTRRETGDALSIYGHVITTQVLDIGTASAALNAATDMIEVQSRGTGFWVRLGGSDVSAAADTDGNFWIPAGGAKAIEVVSFTHVDTAADA